MKIHLTRREFLRLTATAGVLGAVAPSVLTACGSTSTVNTLDRLKKSGVVKVGIAGEIPYGYSDNGKITGESPEVARAVFQGLGIGDVQATQVEFNSLIPGLVAKQFDMVAAGMFITPARCAQALFSEPDYTAPTALLVPRGNPQHVSNFDDIKSKNLSVAVLSGAVEQTYAKDAGIPEAKTHVFDTQNAALQAVLSNRAYCAALTNISLNALLKQNPAAEVEVTKGFFPIRNGQPVVSAGGFAFRKTDTTLLDAFNEKLRALHDSGRWLEIVTPFGFTAENLPAPDLTTQKLCSAV